MHVRAAEERQYLFIILGFQAREYISRVHAKHFHGRHGPAFDVPQRRCVASLTDKLIVCGVV